MATRETKYPESINPSMIAPCGMNCALCLAHLRQNKPCSGCNSAGSGKPKHCFVCRIKYCTETTNRVQDFCFQCPAFPCLRLNQLDKRYRAKYGMSMLENLESIRELGLDGFVSREQRRWKCPQCGAVICVHRIDCIYCGHPRSAARAN